MAKTESSRLPAKLLLLQSENGEPPEALEDLRAFRPDRQLGIRQEDATRSPKARAIRMSSPIGGWWVPLSYLLSRKRELE